MSRKVSIIALLAVAFVFTSCRERTVLLSPVDLPPPALASSLFNNDTLTLVWINQNQDTVGFEGYHVYISTSPGLESLSGSDSLLELARVTTAPMGLTEDTVIARFTALKDGTKLSDVDSFFAHIRCVVNGLAGSSYTEYAFHPATDTIPDSLALPVVNVAFTVVDGQDGNPGGAVHLTWDPFPGSAPDEYVVSVDGVDYVPSSEPEQTVNDPGAEVAVYAVYGSKRSQAVTLNFGAVETASLDVWTTDDPSPDHPSSFGFTPIGSAVTYLISNQASWPSVDYYIASGFYIVSPSDHLPSPLNNEVNAAASETGSYDGLKITSPTGQSFYFTVLSLASNGVYSLWIDPTNNGYSLDDNFAKILVTSLGESGDIYKVTLRLAYQPVPGLRWVVAD